MSKPIRSIQELNRSIRALREQQKTLEGKMDESLKNLKENYFNMTLNSVFGERKAHTPFWASILSRSMESEKVQQGISNLVEKILEKLGNIMKK
jgi:vacuolar-type H+-ATPase subunit E/Vma4